MKAEKVLKESLSSKENVVNLSSANVETEQTKKDVFVGNNLSDKPRQVEAGLLKEVVSMRVRVLFEGFPLWLIVLN